MNTAELANFFRSLGHRVIETKSCFWYSPRHFLFKSLPVHQVVNPGSGELASVFLRGPAFALRYPSLPGEMRPDGGMYVCSGRDYDFPKLSSNARSHTRRGLARCKVDMIEFGYLARHGYSLIEDTNLRQTGRRPPTTLSQWERFCDQASRTRDIEAWGALVENKLAAFIVGMQIDDCFYIHLQKSATASLKYYPNNALTFILVGTKLASGAASYVSHGQIALAAKEGLDHFKRAMGFEVQPFKEQVVFNPIVRQTLWLGRGVAGMFERRYPENLFWRRVSRSLALASQN